MFLEGVGGRVVGRAMLKGRRSAERLRNLRAVHKDGSRSRSLRAMLRDGDQTHSGRGTVVRYTGTGASRGTFVRCSGTETRQRAVAEPSCDTQGREPASRGTFVRCSRAYEKQRLRQVSDVLVSLLMRNKTPAASLQCFFEFGMRNKTHAGNNRGGV